MIHTITNNDKQNDTPRQIHTDTHNDTHTHTHNDTKSHAITHIK